jgi:copper chaperone CopZ
MKETTLASASVFAAVVASLCCILPIVFALAGVGIVGASAAFAEWRPYLLGLTFLLLGAGFYFAYRKPRETCAPDSACAMPTTNRTGRRILWIATGFVLLLAAFPYYSGPVAGWVLGSSAATPVRPDSVSQVASISFAIEGMDCAACATAIENKLKNLPGVHRAQVSYEEGRAEIEFDPGHVSVDALERAIAEAGYKATKT